MVPKEKSIFARRFRGFLPVVVDLETAGFNAKKNALLEIAAVTLNINDQGKLSIHEIHASHIKPFKGSQLDQSALDFTGIDPYHPFRLAVDEDEALKTIFKAVRVAIKENACTRAILVGHNPAFDIGFLNAAVERNRIKKNPFHPFSTFDTATLGGLVYGETVLEKIAHAAGLSWDKNQAHSAIYDAERTAELFCRMVNRWKDLIEVEQRF